MLGTLLDTHTLLWTAQDSPELSRTARQTLRLHSTKAFVSVVSFWEIAMKSARGGLKLRTPFERLLYDEIEENAYRCLDWSASIFSYTIGSPFPLTATPTLLTG